MHVSTGAFLPCRAVQQSQRAPDDVASLFILATVGLDDAEIFFGRTKANTHGISVQQSLNFAGFVVRRKVGTCAEALLTTDKCSIDVVLNCELSDHRLTVCAESNA